MALVFDPEATSGDFVHDLVVLFEDLGPGDRIPLHTHPNEEVIIIEEGNPEVFLGDERRVGDPPKTLSIDVREQPT